MSKCHIVGNLMAHYSMYVHQDKRENMYLINMTFFFVDQQFAYLIIIDFESTCWKDDKFKSQEISK